MTGSWTHYWSETIFPDKTIKLCLSFAKRRRWEASVHTVRTSVLWWRSGVMKDNADNWSFVWRTSSPKYHSGKVSSQLLMLRHPPLGDLVFPSRDVLTAFAKTSASRKPSLRCFRRSTLGFPATSLLYSSTVSTASLSGENCCCSVNKSPDHQVRYIQFTFAVWAPWSMRRSVISHFPSNCNSRDASERISQWERVKTRQQAGRRDVTFGRNFSSGGFLPFTFFF